MTQASPAFLGRQALITGAGSGIGCAIATSLAEAGASVHLLGRSAAVESVAIALRQQGASAHAYRGSVADEPFCRNLIAGIEHDAGHLDFLVNAAAVLGTPGPFASTDMAQFAQTLQTDLMGTVHCMRWALPGMLRRGQGRIVNFAGGGAAYAYPDFSAYGVSKCAVVRLTETVAAEITSPGVTVNVIAPGAVETAMLAQVRQYGGEVRTVTGVDEAVRLVHFLLSPAAANITGRFIHVRDRYTDPGLYQDASMLKLRRLEQR